MAACKVCGYQMEEKETVCPMCGAEVKVEQEQQPASGGVRLCPACCCPVEENDAVCSLCGRELRPAAKTAAPQPVQTAAPKCKCPSCGAEADAAAQFCPACGKRLGQNAVNPPVQGAQETDKKGWLYLLGALGLFFLLWLITNNI